MLRDAKRELEKPFIVGNLPIKAFWYEIYII